jgi:hypothetical protein
MLDREILSHVMAPWGLEKLPLFKDLLRDLR